MNLCLWWENDQVLVIHNSPKSSWLHEFDFHHHRNLPRNNSWLQTLKIGWTKISKVILTWNLRKSIVIIDCSWIYIKPYYGRVSNITIPTFIYFEPEHCHIEDIHRIISRCTFGSGFIGYNFAQIIFNQASHLYWGHCADWYAAYFSENYYLTAQTRPPRTKTAVHINLNSLFTLD